MGFAPEKMGTAPVWRATGDGDYTIPANYSCIGFCADAGGVVAFTSNGVAVTPTVSAGAQYPARVDSFQASGTTATGIYAMLVRG